MKVTIKAKKANGFQEKRKKPNDMICNDNDMIPPPCPPTGGEGDFFDLSSISPPEDQVKRNYPALVNALMKFNCNEKDKRELIIKSNYGEIGNPVWKYIQEPLQPNSGIKMPCKYILSKL